PPAPTPPPHPSPTRRSSDLSSPRRMARDQAGGSSGTTRWDAREPAGNVGPAHGEQPTMPETLRRVRPTPFLGDLGNPHQGICTLDRKSTRLNSSHLVISYAV